MKNNPNSSIQTTKPQIPTFDFLYKNHLSDAAEKFKVVRQKLYFLSISCVSGVIVASSILYMILQWRGIQRVENAISIWIMVFIFTTLILLLHNETKNRNYYNQILIFNYITLNLILSLIHI